MVQAVLGSVFVVDDLFQGFFVSLVPFFDFFFCITFVSRGVGFGLCGARELGRDPNLKLGFFLQRLC